MAESTAAPTAVEPMARCHRRRPSVRSFILARANELVNSPTQNAASDASTMRGVCANTVSQRRLVGVAGRGGQPQHHHRHERRERQRAKARPHHPPGPRVAVHLREDVAEQVGDGKEQDPRPEGEPPDLADLGRADEVAAQQHRHESRHHELVVLERAALRVGGFAQGFFGKGFAGGRCRIRTYDFHRVKVALYRSVKRPSKPSIDRAPGGFKGLCPRRKTD